MDSGRGPRRPAAHRPQALGAARARGTLAALILLLAGAGAQEPQRPSERPVELPPIDLPSGRSSTTSRPQPSRDPSLERFEEEGLRRERREIERRMAERRPSPTWKLVLMGAIVVVAGVLVLTLGVHMRSRGRR